ncbi:PTS transporter subunit EIIB [Candidatus Mycoplasma mahonii]|uniref:PTS transporter subunit EIIB n=1 Tax=Candidatus Mycoplasma mahonii TaxID=3004105 RepID=UPI0026EA17B8|nr:PTS transporter subunit EIIB [Candidatus Mycoplasma mahonii]WKX02713.1 PTS transporter subunit EIIB [Candidatus Mycoplasma mahonii]
MKTKDKIILIFISIITLGIYPLIIFRKQKFVETSDELSRSNSSIIDVKILINLLGGKENILSTNNTHTKIKIYFRDKKKVNIDEIKSSKGVSGIFISSDAITIIVGNSAKFLKEQLN